MFSQFLQLFFAGVAQGCVYALVALGFVLIYKATETVNFAQGDLMMLGAFFGLTGGTFLGFPYWATILFAVIVMALIGMLIINLDGCYERVNDAVAEPVVYMLDRYVVGGFYRVHAERGIDENLNAPGASFVPLAFAEPGQLPKPGVKPGASAPNRFYMYGVVARLAMVAASYELEATDPDAEMYE